MTNKAHALKRVLKRTARTEVSTVKTAWRKLLVMAIASMVLVGIGVWVSANRNDDGAASTNPVVKEYSARLPALKKRVQDKPNDLSAHVDYAIALYATGDIKTARSQYERAVELDGNNATVYNNLGNAYRDLGDMQKAVEAYQKAIVINGKLLNPYFNLANVQLYNLNDANAAISTYKKALTELPDNEQLLLSLGIAYENKHDNTKAGQVYRSILAKNPESAAAKANLERLNK